MQTPVAAPASEQPRPAAGTSDAARRSGAAPTKPPAHRADQQVELAVTGELDKTAAGRLATRLDQAVSAGARHLVIDLSRVTHLDGPAARSLLHRSWRVEADAGTLRLTGPTRTVRRVLSWYGAHHLVVR